MFELPETSSASQASLPCESVTHDAVVVWRSILLQLVVLGTPSVLVFRMVPIPIGDDVDEGDADSTWHRMAKVIKLVTDPGSDRQALDSGDGSAGGRFEKGTMTLERKLMVPLLLRSSPNVIRLSPPRSMRTGPPCSGGGPAVARKVNGTFSPVSGSIPVGIAPATVSSIPSQGNVWSR